MRSPSGAGDGHVFIGGQLQIFGDGGGVLGGEQVEPHRHVLSGGTVGKNRGEGKGGGGDGGSGVGLELHPTHCGHRHGVSDRQVGIAHREDTGVGIGQGGEDDGVQVLLAGLYHKISGGEGKSAVHSAVFGKGGDSGFLGRSPKELCRCGESHGGRQGRHEDQQRGPLVDAGSFQREDLL